MAEKFRFMDPVQLPDGTYDREYNAQEFTDYFKALITTGIMKSVGNQLAVSANGSNMVSSIANGVAFILGRYYENDSVVNLTHDTETLGNSRIDRVVIRMDLSPDKRYVLAFIKKGTPSANPLPPTLTQTANIYEISLAQVRIVGGQTFIATNAVTDERGINVICPWAGSNILPSYDDNALANLINDSKEWQRFKLTKDTGQVKRLSDVPGVYNRFVDLPVGEYFITGAESQNFSDNLSSSAGRFVKVSRSSEVTIIEIRLNVASPTGHLVYKKIHNSISNAESGWIKQLDENDLTLPTPTVASLVSGWVHDTASGVSLSYYKDSTGTVYLYGAVYNNNDTGLMTITTLPVGFRPTVNRNFQVTNGITGSTYIDILTTGVVRIWGASAGAKRLSTVINAVFRTT